ncbi:hypothetical protein [Mesorhizobium sp. IMUNJ 23232]|uniref:hypothetical protein n=1 Tax=Mesorhizobium sp. IMUNJ 23232 TaxID=3376064 RepID=UPI0037BB069A
MALALPAAKQPASKTLPAAEKCGQRTQAAREPQRLGVTVEIRRMDFHGRQGKHTADPPDGKFPRDGLGMPHERQQQDAEKEWLNAKKLGQNRQPKQHDRDPRQPFPILLDLTAAHCVLRSRHHNRAWTKSKDIIPIPRSAIQSAQTTCEAAGIRCDMYRSNEKGYGPA